MSSSYSTFPYIHSSSSYPSPRRRGARHTRLDFSGGGAARGSEKSGGRKWKQAGSWRKKPEAGRGNRARSKAEQSARIALRGHRSSTIDSSTMGSKLSVSSLLLLLLFLVEVHSQQTIPYVSFGLTGPALANHSYVNLSTVGSAGDNSDSVVCHTDLSTCCSGNQGIYRGDWYFPDGTVLPFTGFTFPIGLGRSAQVAIIRRTNHATGPTGIYRCDIPTNAVHSDIDQSVGETVYMGLYPAIGGKSGTD